MQSRLSVCVFACLALVASTAVAQPGGRGGRGGGGGFGSSGSLGLLQDESVRRELEIADKQVSKLRDIQESYREEMQSYLQGFDFGDLRNLSDEERQERFAEIGKRREEITAKAQKELDELLLPNQRERLKQLTIQQQLRFQGVQGALASGSLAETLSITAEQKEQLAEKARVAQVKLQEAIEKARQDAQDEILTVLTPAQQAQLKEMMGSTFVFQSPGFGGQGGFGGSPGGRGGPGSGDGGGRGGRGHEGGESKTRGPRSPGSD